MVNSGTASERAASDGLEDALVDLGGRVRFPATPDLAAGVSRRLIVPEGDGVRRAGVWPVRRPVWLRIAVAAVLTLVLGGVVAGAVVPGAREAIADRIGLGGVEIRFGDATAVASPVGEQLMLGRRVALSEAERAFGSPLLVPDRTTLGPPDEVYLSRTEGDPMVSFVYRERIGFPVSPHSGAAALLSQMPGGTERGLILKGIVAKEVGREGRLEAVDVAGAAGFWLEGEAHGFFYRDPADSVRRVEYRLAGNVLIWEVGGVTFRLEANISREAALAVVGSLGPAPGVETATGTAVQGGG